jgi:hypothetical protein
LSDKETRASIEDALGSLDPVERRVIVLACVPGPCQAEITASTGWPTRLLAGSENLLATNRNAHASPGRF